MSLAEIFPHVSKPIIGKIHLSPLAGSYNYTGQALDDIVEHTVREADSLASAGFDSSVRQP